MEKALGAQGQAGQAQWLSFECASDHYLICCLEPLRNLGAGSLEEIPA